MGATVCHKFRPFVGSTASHTASSGADHDTQALMKIIGGDLRYRYYSSRQPTHLAPPNRGHISHKLSGTHLYPCFLHTGSAQEGPILLAQTSTGSTNFLTNQSNLSAPDLAGRRINTHESFWRSTGRPTGDELAAHSGRVVLLPEAMSYLLQVDRICHRGVMGRGPSMEDGFQSVQVGL